MAKTALPRPSLNPTPSAKEGAKTPVVDNSALLQAMEDAGLAPNTISFKRAESQQSERSLADLLDDEIVAEILKDDLTDGEAKLFAGAMWIGKYSQNTVRARSIWRVMTFLLKYPMAGPGDIPLRLLTGSFFASYERPRTTMSSLVHAWMKAGVFARSRGKLNTYSLRRWTQHRRNQLDVICEWEAQLCDRIEVRRKDRLVKKLKPRGSKK